MRRLQALFVSAVLIATVGVASPRFTTPAHAQPTAQATPTAPPPTTGPPPSPPNPIAQPTAELVPIEGQPLAADLATRPIGVDGGTARVDTERRVNFLFESASGKAVVVQTNRPWRIEDPFGTDIATGAANRPQLVLLDATGRYVLKLLDGLKAPATATLTSADPNSLVAAAAVGETMQFHRTELRPEFVRIGVRGGQRYRLNRPSGERGTHVCAYEWVGPRRNTVACAGSAQPTSVGTFLLLHDGELVLEASFDGAPLDVSSSGPWVDGNGLPISDVATASITEAPNDLVADPRKGPIVDATPLAGQSIVVPFWGQPSERAVVSSPTEDLVTPWGQPWIDKETPATGEPVKVFAVPVTFSPGADPFVAWRTDVSPAPPNRQRVAVYRGEDRAVVVAANGAPVAIQNLPWFASVGSLRLEGGSRYVLQVTGKSIRPLSLAVRDPSGKFTSNLTPWQWSEDGGEQRAITTISSNRTGLWALEARQQGNAVRDLSISLLKVGVGVSYEGLVDVGEPLTVGDRTDVSLGPSEFARLTVKLTSATPQIIQPEVLRYRGKTFQATAADMSIWDSRGRLVWSNNKNLEEEVLSGRLGKEPELAERFATVASAEPYTLVIDPHTDLSGRFRVSVVSTPVFSDVALGTGRIPTLAGGTRTGVVEVTTPTRYRLTGASACVSASSTRELNASPTRAPTSVCIADGQSVSLPPGVHRFAFKEPVTANASFDVIGAGSPPDAVPTSDVAVNGGSASIPRGNNYGVIRFDIAKAPARLSFVGQASGSLTSVLLNGAVVGPSGLPESIERGNYLARTAGRYEFRVEQLPDTSMAVAVREDPVEVESATLAVGARAQLRTMRWGRRFEATVRVNSRARIGLDAFGSVALLYVAAGDEVRHAVGIAEPYPNSSVPVPEVVLSPGTYRFVFEGDGDVRLALKSRKISRPSVAF